MKRLLIILAAAMMAVGAMAEDSTKVVIQPSISRSDSLLMDNNELLELIERDISLKERYKLYPTQNMYNFLRLDTKTGMIDKVQWNLEEEKEFIASINSDDLSYGNSHFELYPTQNMYQFLMIDKTTGRVWHVQWGFKPSERWIKRIYW